MSSTVCNTLLLLGIVYFPVSMMARSCSVTPDVSVLIKKIGESVSIYCSSAGNNAIATFMQGDRRLTDEDSKVEGSLVANERVLRIRNVSRSDAGFYSCVARIQGVSEEIHCGTIDLRVHDEIRFTNAEKEAVQYIMEGRTGDLNCTAESDSVITYEWYANQKKISRNGAGNSPYTATGGTLGLTGAKKLNGFVFTCRASLKDFSYFRDLKITLGLKEGEPLNCLTCRHIGIGTMTDDEPCAKGTAIQETTVCESSCVTINATGPAEYDGTYKYGTIRGCGDKLSIIKERCITMPNEVFQMSALSMFGDVAGLTYGTVCFCSSGDKCNIESRKYSIAASGCEKVTSVAGFGLGTLLLLLVTIFQY